MQSMNTYPQKFGCESRATCPGSGLHYRCPPLRFFCLLRRLVSLVCSHRLLAVRTPKVTQGQDVFLLRMLLHGKRMVR